MCTSSLFAGIALEYTSSAAGVRGEFPPNLLRPEHQLRGPPAAAHHQRPALRSRAHRVAPQLECARVRRAARLQRERLPPGAERRAPQPLRRPRVPRRRIPRALSLCSHQCSPPIASTCNVMYQ